MRSQLRGVRASLRNGLCEDRREGKALGDAAQRGFARPSILDKKFGRNSTTWSVDVGGFNASVREKGHSKRKLGNVHTTAADLLSQLRQPCKGVGAGRGVAAADITKEPLYDEPDCRLLCRAKHGMCTYRRGQRHLVLDGGAKTSAAAKYPAGLALRLAECLVGVGRSGFVLDGFAGSEIVGDACLDLGARVMSQDICRDPSEDMCSPIFLKFIEEQCRLQTLRSVMLPFPCRTFSLAQSRSGHALRSQLEPRGVSKPHNESQRAAIREGNQMLDAMIQMILVLNRYRIPFIAENPQSSYIWHDRELLMVLKGRWKTIHQRAFGSRSRKATTLVFCNFG